MIGRWNKRLHSRRTAAIYERNGIIVIEGAAYWEGASAMTELLHVLAPNTSDGEVGAALIDAFERFDSLPIRKGHNPQIFKAVGVTSYTRLIKEARYVLASQDDRSITLTPHRPHPPGGWTREALDPTVDLVDAMPAELGGAVRSASRLADSFY